MPGVGYTEDQIKPSYEPGSDVDKISDKTAQELRMKDYDIKNDQLYKTRSRKLSFYDNDSRRDENNSITEYIKKEDYRSSVILNYYDKDVPYDRGWAWMVDLGSFILFFIYVSHEHWHSVLLIDYLTEFDISVSLVTVMLSLGNLCYCVATQISANVLAKKFTTRNVTTCAAILNFLATLLFAVSPNVVTFFVVNMIKYSAMGITLIIVIILVGFYFRRRRGLATTLVLLGMSTSFIIIPPLIHYLKEKYGLRGCFLILAGIEMHGVPAALLLRPVQNYSHKREPSQVSIAEGPIEEMDSKSSVVSLATYQSLTCYSQHPSSQKCSKGSNLTFLADSSMCATINIPHIIELEPFEDEKLDARLHRYRWVKEVFDLSLLRNYIAVMVVAMFILINTSSLSVVFLPSYAKGVGVTSQNAAILLTIIGAMDIIGRLFFGFWADLKCVRPYIIVAFSSACLGIVTHFIVILDGFEKLVFFAAMHGFLAGAGHNLTTVLIIDEFGIQHLTKMLSICSMFSSISMVIQHPIHGAIIEATGSFIITYDYVGTSFILASILLLCEPLIRKLQIAKEKKQRNEEASRNSI